MRAALLALALAAAPAAAAPPDCPILPARAVSERMLAIPTEAGRIAATLAAPADGPPRALALMLHGYTGARDEIPVAGGEGMFARAARAFAAAGIAALRIDFLGSGASDGAWADTTFAGQARDAQAAAAFLADLPGHAGLPLGALGYSQGGLVALRAAAAFDRVALWNPVLEPRATYARVFGDRFAAGLAARGAAVVPGTGLRPAFFGGIAAADPMADAAAAAVPLLLVVGARDALTADGPALGARLAATRSAPTRVLAVEVGHDLGAVGDVALLDAVIACTAAFLRDGP